MLREPLQQLADAEKLGDLLDPPTLLAPSWSRQRGRSGTTLS
jgi:hypothetical protein